MATNILAQTIARELEALGESLTNKFKNSEIHIASDLVTKLYDKVREEDNSKNSTSRQDDVNGSKVLFNTSTKRAIDRFFNDFVQPNLSRVELSSNMDFLNVLLTNWGYIKVFAMTFKFILSKHSNHYMHAKQINENSRSIAYLILEAVRLYILNVYQDKITEIVNDTFEKERNLQNTEKQKVKELIDIIENCGLYELSDVTPSGIKTKSIEFKKYEIEKNEKPLLPETIPYDYFNQNYFGEILSSCVQSYKKRIAQLPNQPSEYVAEVLKILKSERERAQYYFFDNRLKEQYLIGIEQELVDKRVLDVLSYPNGFENFIESSSQKDLVGTYVLCKRRQDKTFEFLKKKMNEFFISFGKRISHTFLESQKKDPIAYVESMIGLKKKINEIVDVFFKKDLEFTKLRNQVCKDILRYEGDQKEGVKKFEFLGARNLAQYTDKKVKQCAKMDAADRVDQILNNIILVFQSLMSQDKFLSEHQIAMSKRFLQPYTNKPNSEIEKLLITKLSQIVGPKDVEKHLGMIRDFDWSVDFEQKLAQRLQGTSVRIQPYVLQSDCWPDNEDVDITFPTALVSEKSKVEDIYSNITSGKCLIWKVNRGISQLQMKFGANTYRFTLNNLMMFIILHIAESNNNSILYGTLKQNFKLKRLKTEEQGGSLFENEFRLNLLTLVEQKLVIRDRGLDPDINEGETFTINKNYVYVPSRPQLEKKATKLKSNVTNVNLIPSPKLKNELKVGTMNTNQMIKKSRQTVMNGVVVQLMKNYKTMQFDNLIAEMRKHRQMQNVEIRIADVKERIQYLITNDYVDRDDSDRNKLIYKP